MDDPTATCGSSRWRHRLGRISTQVLHELYATLTRKLSAPIDEARTIVRALSAWQPQFVWLSPSAERF